MQSPTFDVKPTRVYPDRQRVGRSKTIFNLLDIPVKVILSDFPAKKYVHA